LELDPVASALLVDRLKFLQSHGIGVTEFGRNFFRIESVPTWLEPSDAESFLRDLLGAFREGRFPTDNTDLAREELARLASAKAIRLPEGSDEEPWRVLLEELFRCQMPHRSPSGRPTYFEMSHGEIARRFQK